MHKQCDDPPRHLPRGPEKMICGAARDRFPPLAGPDEAARCYPKSALGSFFKGLRRWILR